MVLNTASDIGDDNKTERAIRKQYSVAEESRISTWHDS